MWSEELETRWQQLAEEVMVGMKEWRLQHPRATFQEIEAALDERLARVRARMLQDVALASAATEINKLRPEERPPCPQCGHPLEGRGQETRHLTTNYNQTISLKRSYAHCPACDRGLFPLDEELGLLPGTLSPSLVESIMRLGTWMPFGPTAQMLGHFTQVAVSEPTVRRTTERAGQAYVEVQEAQVAALEQGMPEAAPGPPVQQVSVDGAYVPLRGKDAWAEVKTLAIGTVGEAGLNRQGEWEVHTSELSYFSRLADHETFGRLATVETHRRGTEKAGVVCGVVDGAEWEQKFLDLHRPDAVRILDWRHAREYLVQAGQAAFGEGTEATSEWLGVQLYQLRHGDPQQVLRALRGLKEALADAGERLKVVVGSLEYLEKRQEQIRYAEFEAQGYPIGSGAVESANKLVVEARLKGAGMHWAREHVNPMVALRNIACSDRWEEAWPQIRERLRQQGKERGAQRRLDRRAAQEVALAATPPAQVVEEPVAPTSARMVAPKSQRSSTIGPRRPPTNHPWRHAPVRPPWRTQAPRPVGAKT